MIMWSRFYVYKIHTYAFHIYDAKEVERDERERIKNK